LPDFLKKVQQGCHVFVKKSGKVGENFKKILMTLPVFSKKVREGYGKFRKNYLPAAGNSPGFTAPLNPDH
jgi:hypothetical protein